MPGRACATAATSTRKAYTSFRSAMSCADAEDSRVSGLAFRCTHSAMAPRVDGNSNAAMNAVSPGPVQTPILPDFIASMGAEPAGDAGTFLQAVSLTGAYRRIPRRTLVFASRWPATPFRPQYEKLRHDPQWETHELTTGHDVMREAPDDVVALLTS